MRRSLVLALVAALIALVPASPANAGGAVMRPDRNVYVPGELAGVRGTFSKNGSYEGTLADGPYVAYLLPEGVWIERTHVPVSAIRLGELRIGRRGGSFYPRAVVRFEVPDVPAGWYHVEYCNDPCTVDGIGDLMGSFRFVVAPTRLEARHIWLVDRLQERIDSARRKAHAHARVEQRGLERALQARTAELRDARGQVAELKSETARLRSRTGDEPLVPGWTFVLLALALVVAALVVRRRGEPPFVVPDTLPDDLIEIQRDRAGVGRTLPPSR